MPVPVIVIEIAAQRPAPEHLPTLVEACNRSAVGAKCVLEVEPDARPDAVAIVHWEDRDRVRIEVGVRRGERSDWRTRDFAFSANDELTERWRAVGFAIGTLASDQRREEASAGTPESEKEPPPKPPPKPAKQSEKPKEEPKEVRRPSKPPVLWLDGGVLFGPGIEGRSFRIGGLLEGAWSPTKSALFVTLGVSGAVATEHPPDADVVARYLDVGAGLGYMLVSAPSVELSLSATAVVEQFSVHVSSGNVSDTQNRWLMGGRGSLVGAYKFTREIGVFVAARGGWFGGATDIRLRDEAFGTVPQYRLGLGAGLRITLR